MVSGCSTLQLEPTQSPALSMGREAIQLQAVAQDLVFMANRVLAACNVSDPDALLLADHLRTILCPLLDHNLVSDDGRLWHRNRDSLGRPMPSFSLAVGGGSSSGAGSRRPESSRQNESSNRTTTSSRARTDADGGDITLAARPHPTSRKRLLEAVVDDSYGITTSTDGMVAAAMKAVKREDSTREKGHPLGRAAATVTQLYMRQHGLPTEFCIAEARALTIHHNTARTIRCRCNVIDVMY